MLMRREITLGNIHTLLLLVFFMEELNMFMLAVMTAIFTLVTHTPPIPTVTPMVTT
jgi:hypothetical protein